MIAAVSPWTTSCNAPSLAFLLLLLLCSSEDKPKWDMVDIRAVRRLKREVTLEELKAHASGALEGMLLLKIPRLSVQPVSKAHWEFILELSEQEPGHS